MESTENKEDVTNEASGLTTQDRPYQGWLVSDKFYKRVLAVVGHYAVGSLAITLTVTIIAFFVMLLTSMYN